MDLHIRVKLLIVIRCFVSGYYEGENYMAFVDKSYTISRSINNISLSGAVGFGVGICPLEILPDDMIPLFDYQYLNSDNYGNYQYKDASIMCWIPKFYYKYGTGSNGLSVNVIDVKGLQEYISDSEANNDGYVLHRAFIDNGIEQPGFFIDKYMCSIKTLGTGNVASSIIKREPISTGSSNNSIDELTACSSNYHYECITAAHARDGVNGAVNENSIFHCASLFQIAALAMLSLAHGQSSESDVYCAWYDPIYNYPKGCNNNSRKDYDEVSNNAGIGDDLRYDRGATKNLGETGSGNPFAKCTHNGQNCGVADLNGLMQEVNIGITSIASTMSITGASQANPCVITVSSTTPLTNVKWIMIDDVNGMDELNNKMYHTTVLNATTFQLDTVDSLGYSSWISGGTITYGNWYVANESTAMKTFTSGNSSATDHWGATGIAALMSELDIKFKDDSMFDLMMGSEDNQVLDDVISGNGWILTGLGLPKDGNAIDSGINLFGRDNFYQYVRNELCVLSCGIYNDYLYAGIWATDMSSSRTSSNDYVGFRCACYLL
jgi:hypothetical protein